MAYYYSASERAFFSSELMSTDAMPSDKVAVADQAYKQLMADQVAGKLIRTGSGNAPESVDQGLTAATRFGDVSFGKVTGTNLDINGNGDVSGTFVVGGAVTIKGSLNAQGGLNVTSITATGTSTLAAVNATNLSLSGTLKVNGASTLQAVSAKKITATEIDLNGSMDASGNVVVHGKTTLEALQANGDVNVGGLLKVTGKSTFIDEVTVPAPTSSNHAARKADVDALTTLTDDGLITLSNGADYNTLVDPGFYAVTNAGSTNQPKSSAFRVIVLSSKNSNYVTQLAVPIYDQESPNAESSSVYFRNRNGNGDTWEKWRELALTTYAHEYGGKNYGVGGGLNTSPSGSSNECFGSSNLNNWDKSGFYSVSITDGQNTPTGQTSWTGILFALMRRWETGTSGLQIAPNGSAFWYRTRSGTEWNPWYILARDDQVVHRTGSENVAGIKNFSDNIQFSGHAVRQLYKNIGIAKGEVPTESQSILLRLIGGTGSTIVANTFSELELCAHNSGDTYVRLWASNNSEGSTAREYIELRYNKAENRFSTRAPAPVTSSDDNSIATTAWVRALFEAGLGSAIPSGVAFPYAGKTVPSGFMACNGGTISRTTYAKLFAAIGTNWGAGDGSTTFKLPDWRNRTVMGANAASEVGTYLESGAPNITGSFVAHYQGNPVSGAFQATGTGRSKSGTDGDGQAISFDASRSNPIYGAADIIQPPSGKALWIIKL